MQSGGTSLVSWCFLQRADTDGVFDMENSVIQTRFDAVRSRYLWVKMTVGSFRWLDVAGIYTDLGYDVKPLLVIRDPRFVYASLAGKDYGSNGTTAEDPPVRMRFRRFLRDWELFRENGWPVIRYEDFVDSPERVLREAAAALGMNWDPDMIEWPVNKQISYMSMGNRTLHESIEQGGGLPRALLQDKATKISRTVPASEKTLLEAEFAEYNTANGYPRYPDAFWSEGEAGRPEFDVTQRKAWLDLQGRLENCESRLSRLRRHVVFGNLIKAWRKTVNRDFDI